MKRLALLLALAGACHPYYRDDELRGRAARDIARVDAAFARAEAAAAKGDARGAAAIAVSALETSPYASTSRYVQAAGYLAAAGNGAAARAILQYRIDHRDAYESDTELRSALVASYLAEGRLADAIDAAAITTFGELIVRDDLREPLAGLVVAFDARSERPAAALAALHRWLDEYGVPDHPLLRGAVDEIRAAVAPALPQLADLVPRAEQALARGDVAPAAVLATEAWRVRPAAATTVVAAVGERATDPAAIDPVAYQHALGGDEALRAGRVGDALRAYRRAVAHAPWWPHARENLRVILESLGRTLPE